ncbi:MAG: deoxyhypusine synthase family protein [Deltaproteobacteria bacterium]|nr:deoxyhypusine synthase family protein [Deltaproteobacteria bacterium]
MRRKFEDFHDGAKDGLEPLAPLDLNKVQDFDELLKAMGRTAFGGRSLGEAADVLTEMVGDPDCTIVGTFSGAMSVAKMGLMICEMIDRGWLQVIITTGALVAHGLIETLGRVHYKCPAGRGDRELYRQGYNRIYDTLEMEANLDYAEEVFREVLKDLDQEQVWCSSSLCRELGRHLAGQSDQPGILRNAYLKGVPVFIPAFTDSELGLDLAIHMVRGALNEGAEFPGALTKLSLSFNPFLDLGAYAEKVVASKKLGIFTVGGGVPRNWAQQVGPYLELLHTRLDLDLPEARFQYGVRICPEPVHWGGLSGCTFKEGVSWGKFVAPEDGGRFAEVLCDATVAWPVLMKAVMQRIEKKSTKK